MPKKEPTKEELCREVMQLVLQDKVRARHSIFLRMPFLHRIYRGSDTLGDVQETDGACSVCALGALFYARIRNTPLRRLQDKYQRSAVLPEGASDDSRIFPFYGEELLEKQHTLKEYALPFTTAELVAFEDFFEGIGNKMTNNLYDSRVTSWTVLQERKEEPYSATEMLLLRIMANFLRNGRLDYQDKQILGLKELERIAHNKELHHESRQDLHNLPCSRR